MDKIEPVTIIAPLRLDFVRGIETVVKENTMRAGHTFADLEFPEVPGSVEALKAGGRTCISSMQLVVRDEFLPEKMRELDLAVIQIPSIRKSRDLNIYAYIDDAENLSKALCFRSTYGENRTFAFDEASRSRIDLPSQLTARQRGLPITAKRYGYYESPRRITGQFLAKKSGISKATAIEHLRRSEARHIFILT